MSANTDTQMTRFLFAILKQKNLKDIDWNAVAKDPVLSQEITNGHAARMRYSRFRSAMLGLEPKPRNTNKNKVTKPKKDIKASGKTATKDNHHNHANKTVKTESGLEDQYSASVKVKQEVSSQQQQSVFNNLHFTPASMASAPTSQAEQAHPSPMRLLTPCSDDMLPSAAPGTFQFGSPVASVFGALDFSSAAAGGPCGHGQDVSHDHLSEQNSWSGSPAAFSAFEAAYSSLNPYGFGDFCEHHQERQQQQCHHQGQADSQPQAQVGDGMHHGPPPMSTSLARRVQVKAEPWDGDGRS